MKKLETSARTVEEAIEQGLQELGVSIGDVEVQVLEEGSKGLFGLFGSRMAKVRLTVKEDEDSLLDDLIGKKEETPRPEEAATRDAVKAEPAKERAQAEEPAKEAKRPAPVKRTAPKKAEKKTEKITEKKAPKESNPAGEDTHSGEEEQAAKPRRQEQEIRTMEKPEITPIPEEQLDPESAAGEACAFLKELTRLMGADVTIEMGTDAEGNVYGSMTGDTLGVLIGRRGETLDAVQYLTSLKVNRGREGYVRVTLDTENYRARREDTLIRLANRMAGRALRTGRRVSLEPMNPYERRIIHYALQQNESVSTHSEGEEPNRHVVITVNR